MIGPAGRGHKCGLPGRECDALPLLSGWQARGCESLREQAELTFAADWRTSSRWRDAILGPASAGAVDSGAGPIDRGHGERSSGDQAARRAWAMPPARGELKGIDLSRLDPDDPDERSILIEAEHPEFAQALKGNTDVEVNGVAVNPRLHLALHEIVANQLWDGQPPETWAAARRLIGIGFERHDVLHMLMRAVSDIVYAALDDPFTDRTAELRAALDALGRGLAGLADIVHEEQAPEQPKRPAQDHGR